MMQAIQMTATGGPEVLRYVELPEPELCAPTQIKVRVKAAGINPVDTKLRRGGLFYPDALPAILGLDGAGIVEAIGSAVERFRPGDKVWYCNGGLGAAPGNYATHHIIEQTHAELMPAHLGFITAAAGPLVLLTAWEALFDRAHLTAGQSVLIHAGAGGVGHVAIQLAKLAGARVMTTVSNDEKAALVQNLGADAVIHYQEQNLLEAVLEWTNGKGVDVALDTVGPAVFEATIPAVAHYGCLLTLLDPGPQNWKEARLRNLCVGFELMLTPLLRDLAPARAHQGKILRQCTEWLNTEQLRLMVSEVFPLIAAAEAHQRIETGHVQGKLVLTMD